MDSLLRALVKKLGYDKALGKLNAEPNTKLVKFSLIRQKEESNISSSSSKKSKKSTSKLSDLNLIKVTPQVSTNLVEMRQYLEDCFTPNGFLKFNHLFHRKFGDLPVKLEICSGFGEWAVKQVDS